MRFQPAAKRVVVLSDITLKVTQQNCDPEAEPQAKIARLEKNDIGIQTTSLASPKEEVLQKRVKSLNQKFARPDLKIDNMKSLLDVLKKMQEL